MRRRESSDHTFEIAFGEGILRRAPDDADVIGMLAHYYTRAGRIDDGLALDLRLVQLDPENATAHYNLACSLALKNRKAEALDALREALSRGYDDLNWLKKDTDLKSLHSFPPFVELLRELALGQP